MIDDDDFNFDNNNNNNNTIPCDVIVAGGSYYSQITSKTSYSRRRVIDYGDVYHDHLYKSRSIVICNKMDVASDFLLNWNVSDEESCELNMSLSGTAIQLIESVVVPLRSKQ
eukprot:Pgem_evm1s12088